MSENDFSAFPCSLQLRIDPTLISKCEMLIPLSSWGQTKKSQFKLGTSEMWWIIWWCSFSLFSDYKLQSEVKVGLSHSQNPSVTTGIIRGLQEEQWAGSCCSSMLGGESSITGKFAQSSGVSHVLWDSVVFESYKTSQVTWKYLIISFTGKNINSVRDGLWNSIIKAKISSRFLAFFELVIILLVWDHFPANGRLKLQRDGKEEGILQ